MARLTALMLALVGLLAMWGCSGAGISAEQASGGTTPALAQDYLSALALFKGWCSALYVKIVGDPDVYFDDPQPDGSTRVHGTLTDGGSFDYLLAADGSGAGTITFAGGDVYTVSWTVPEFTGDVLSQQIHETFGTRAVLDYALSQDFGQATAPQTWDGTATVTGSGTMQFNLFREQQGTDHLTLQLPDGSQLEFFVPTTPVLGTAFWPLFSPGGHGVYTSPVGQVVTFTVSGSGDRWDQWSLQTDTGEAGALTLQADFSGSGNLNEGGSLLGALRWNADLEGTLELVGEPAAAVTPSAAARDFQLDRWVSNVAALGPMPMY